MSIPLLTTLVSPLVLRVEYRDKYWGISRAGCWAWLIAAVGSDLLVQWVTGNLTWLTGVASLLTLSFCKFPVRWLHAAAGLCTGQALVSGVLALGLTHAGAPLYVVAIACYLWAAWCLVAQVLLTLRYIRTPKASFV
ncbi:hypothetical protein AB4Y45_35075 [Paraburkholderia sp. EG287A]|uniref:hypothetical protein n=1 Tax=Paraburkholderia sp. EG287A TaxID=3237012 RepID=UPI0034D29412